MTSRLLSLLVVFALVTSAFVGPAAAVESSTENLPEESEAGSDFQTTFEVTDLFADANSWTLQGETQLTNVTWTITVYDQADTQLRQETYTDATFEEEIDTEGGTNRVEVEVIGTTPEVENFTYDPPENFTAAALTEVRPGGTEHEIATYEAHHYTAESKEAREAIDSAREAVEASSSDDGEAFLESAISSYEAQDFDSAVRDANRAEEEASQSRLLRTAAMGVGGLVVLLLLVAGGYRLYKSRQQSPSRLR